jgi:hypothetical protein
MVAEANSPQEVIDRHGNSREKLDTGADRLKS